jgi:hypothetical protein
VDPTKITAAINSVKPNLQALLSADTGPLIWLTDSSDTTRDAVVDALIAIRPKLNLLPINPVTGRDEGILYGPELAALFADPLTDSRAPDIVLLPKPGTLYSLVGTKIADHGSFNEDDLHVALLVSNPRMPAKTIRQPVETRQIACTILKALALECGWLTSQQMEPSKFLPHSNNGSVDAPDYAKRHGGQARHPADTQAADPSVPTVDEPVAALLAADAE